MAWKQLKEQPPEWIDLPKEGKSELRTKKDINADNRNAKKLIAWNFELAKKFKYPLNTKDPVVNQLLKQIQSGQYKEINIQTSLLEDGKLQPTIFHFTRGSIIPEAWLKSVVQEFNPTDVLILRKCQPPSHSLIQLKSAIVIIFSVIIEHFIGEEFQSSLNIGEALKLTLKEIERNPSPNQQKEIGVFAGLIEVSELFEDYCALPQVNNVSLQEFFNELDIIKASAKIKEFEELDKFEKKYPPQTPLHNRIRYMLRLFQIIINQAIDIGLLDKFKVSTTQGNQNISIATKHHLLNEKKLLSRLNGDERSQRANQGKTQITERIKQKINELLKAHSNEKYKSINEAAETFRVLLTEKITQIIHDDQQSYQHNFRYGEDHYFELIKSIIKADDELKSQYNRKSLKNNK